VMQAGARLCARAEMRAYLALHRPAVVAGLMAAIDAGRHCERSEVVWYSP